jgi:hypothetical protein
MTLTFGNSSLISACLACSFFFRMEDCCSLSNFFCLSLAIFSIFVAYEEEGRRRQRGKKIGRFLKFISKPYLL